MNIEKEHFGGIKEPGTDFLPAAKCENDILLVTDILAELGLNNSVFVTSHLPLHGASVPSFVKVVFDNANVVFKLTTKLSEL